MQDYSWIFKLNLLIMGLVLVAYFMSGARSEKFAAAMTSFFGGGHVETSLEQKAGR